jgi:hypothetical protein
MRDSIPILIAAAVGLIVGLVRRHFLRRANRKEFARRLAGLKARFPNKSFVVVAYPPFLVVTDEDQAEVATRLEHTIPWAIENLKT